MKKFSSNSQFSIKKMINIPKGTKDLLPQISHKWHEIEGIAREVARVFNCHEIRTPIFEHTELFTRSLGDEAEVVSKQMYSFLDKANRSLTLKPEGTAPVARSFVENNLEQYGLPQKMYYISPIFRYENPQAGRLRQHHQFGIEFYGSSSPYADAEVILLAKTFLSKCGVTANLTLNNIGCAECRTEYNNALKKQLEKQKDCLCGLCQNRLNKNTLRILDCKSPNCKNIIKDAPKISKFVCECCKEHFKKLTDILKNEKINFTIDDNVVRGLDYYSKTVFEFAGNDGMAICGGGRYDGMVEELGGKQTPCVGFGVGIERILLAAEKEGREFEQKTVDYYIASLSPEQLDYCFDLSQKLRAKGISCEVDLMNRSLKSQLKFADKIKAKYSIVVGEDELKSGQLKQKDMRTGEVTEFKL
ncbi:MAG: histidine--tRNA ligase [Firmicutes bacterium]|nr:histidine--tRNA ligase [Bacillota bacterium]